MPSRRPPPGSKRWAIESLSTVELLALHECHFGRLDPRGKARIVLIARRHGWDRSDFGLDRLAA